MMKKMFGISIALLLALPTLAFSDSEVTVPMLLSRVAFMQAESTGMGIGCATMTSTNAARIGEPYIVAWGSYGARSPESSNTSAWAPSGMQIVLAQKPGTYRYIFQFAGPGGVATCFSSVTVSAR